jgi:hypothetical protein
VPVAPIVVLGMHRSGTSLAASLLADAGLDVGQRLVGADASNPRGHFEDDDFHRFDQRVLRALCADSDGWVAATLTAPTEEWVSRARALAAEKQARGRPWGWKDPRTVPLLPLWRQAVPDAWYAIVYRNPWEVVDSLFRRGDAAFDHDAELAVRVWQHYNSLLADLARSAPDRCVVANVDAVVADPARWVAAVAARTSVPLAATGRGVVDSSLQHGRRARAFADVVRRWYPEVIATYDALQRLAPDWAGSGPAAPHALALASGEAAREAMANWRDAVAPAVRRSGVAARDPHAQDAWLLSLNADANVALLLRSADGGTFRVAIERAGSGNLWDIQLRRRHVPIVAGVTYELAFRARASAPRRIAFGVNGGDYRSIGLFEEAQLGESWQRFAASFVATASDEAHVDVGADAASVDLADVVLRRAADRVVIASGQPR